MFVRTVVVWHITWSVNSVTHRWGYRNYETDEGSRNNVLVGLVSNGEGWHNNHHADPRSARHGHRWWEFDVDLAHSAAAGSARAREAGHRDRSPRSADIAARPTDDPRRPGRSRAVDRECTAARARRRH